jgi:hypothetical protein
MSAQLTTLRDQLKNEMSSNTPNLQSMGQLLTQAKVSCFKHLGFIATYPVPLYTCTYMN